MQKFLTSKKGSKTGKGVGFYFLLFNVLFLSFSTYSLYAATFTVTNNADSGAGSLRDAMTNANLSAGNTIVLSNALNGLTINLASNLPP